MWLGKTNNGAYLLRKEPLETHLFVCTDMDGNKSTMNDFFISDDVVILNIYDVENKLGIKLKELEQIKL